MKTDNGPQFTPLWPQANGELERQKKSLLKILKIAQAEKKNLMV